MGHAPDGLVPPPALLDTVTAEHLAATLQALAAPSRLRILSRLRQGPCAATELAAAIDMEHSACSHQLRILRTLSLVTRTRQGRTAIYTLFDHHVAELLDQALAHVEHLRL